MKFNVTCPRCGGSGKNRTVCPVCHGEGRVERTEIAGSSHQAGYARRPAHSTAGPRQCRHHGRARGRSLHHRARRRASGFQARGDDIYLTVPVTVHRSRAGREDRGADHRWPGSAEDSSRHAVRTEAATAGKRCSVGVKEGVRGDEIVEVQTVTPKVSDETLKGDSARTGKAESGRSAGRVVEESVKGTQVASSDSQLAIAQQFHRNCHDERGIVMTRVARHLLFETVVLSRVRRSRTESKDRYSCKRDWCGKVGDPRRRCAPSR